MLFIEFKQNVEENLTRLMDSFEGFGFSFNAVEVGDLDDIDTFQNLVLDGDCKMDFEDFKRGIKKTLFSEDDDVKVSDLDWDIVEDNYESAVNSLIEFQNFQNQVEGAFDIDSGVDLDNVELLNDEDMMKSLFDKALSEKKIIPVETDNETYYILNPDYE
ncbi:hypothetical protein [Acinetobacter sp. P1(2025)]|uniref:hypothetical protein n=1 Tax=Acinetobacter sp. P1(2025) TaxID=3446120 RepID=UPI003F53C819